MLAILDEDCDQTLLLDENRIENRTVISHFNSIWVCTIFQSLILYDCYLHQSYSNKGLKCKIKGILGYQGRQIGYLIILKKSKKKYEKK